MIEPAQHPLYKPRGMTAMLVLRVAGKNAEEHVAIGHMLLAELIVVLPNKGHPSNSFAAYSALETDASSTDLSPHRHVCL